MTKNIRRVIKHTIWAAAICLVMGMGIVSYADDTGTVTAATANIRQSADTSSTSIGSVKKGDSVEIIAKTTGSDGKVWYQVRVNSNTNGFIRSDLVKADGKGTVSELTSDTDSTSTSVATASTGTCVVSSEKTARVRSSTSTSDNSNVVANVNKGTSLTITGETTGSDGKKWYQVSFTYNGKDVTGYIRSDLVTVTTEAVTSEITGESSVEVETEIETEVETEVAETTSGTALSIPIPIAIDEVPYILPGFKSVKVKWNDNDESVDAYGNGGFYLYYGRDDDGEEGWYMLDYEKGTYQRYVYTASATATVPSGSDSIGLIPVIILVVIIIILAAVIGLLIIKLRDAQYDDEYDDDSDDENEGDLEFEQISPKQTQRQAKPVTSEQAQRRQASQTGQNIKAGANGNVQRRPVSQSSQGQQTGANGNAQRRPVGQSSQGQQTGANGNAQRRAVSQSSQGQQTGANGNVQRRPANPNAQASANAAAQRRQNVQRRPASNADVAQGQKSKPMLENKDDDIDFIDI